MNILVIGNGFDLSHGLKTSYVNFIDFCSCVKSIDQGDYIRKDDDKIIENLNTIKKDISEKQYNKIVECFTGQSSTEKQLFIHQCHCNFWLYYALKKKKEENKNWSYLEFLIGEYLESLSWLSVDPVNRVYFLEEKEKNYELKKEIIEDMKNGYGNDKFWLKFEDYKELLLKYLKELTEMLEFYLDNFLEYTEKSNELFHKLNIDKLINFNYTSTFHDLYDENNFIETHYVHGKIRLDKTNPNNMVFGVGLEIKDIDIETEIKYSGFQKYFQRIVKKTGNQYKNWLKEIKDKEENSNVFIFGHSLDTPDGDIISTLVCNKFVSTYIFYRDEDEINSFVRNLIKILTKEKLIELTGDNKLNFINLFDGEEIDKMLEKVVAIEETVEV